MAVTTAESGITVGYHNHTQEFAAEFNGQTGFERFASLLCPDVALEIDVFRAATAIADTQA